MTDTTNDQRLIAARAEHAAIHEFVKERLDAIRDAGDDPNPFAQALLATAVGLTEVLRGPDMAAGELAHMATEIAATRNVAGRA